MSASTARAMLGLSYLQLDRDRGKAQLHPLTNVPTKYELPTPYGFRDMVLTRFFQGHYGKVKGQIKVKL